jgi:hypothetical protein
VRNVEVGHINSREEDASLGGQAACSTGTVLYCDTRKPHGKTRKRNFRCFSVLLVLRRRIEISSYEARRRALPNDLRSAAQRSKRRGTCTPEATRRRNVPSGPPVDSALELGV